MHELTDISAVQKNGGKFDAAANAITNVTLAAIADEFHVIDSVHFGYDQVTSKADSLTVWFGGVLKHIVQIAADVAGAGPHEIHFSGGLYTGTLNEAVIVQLSAGGPGVTGKLNFTYR